MEFDNGAVAKEFERWMQLVGPDDPYASQSTCGLRDVLKAHFAIVDYFTTEGRGLGGVGPKTLDLLHSAIYRQFVAYGGHDKWATPIEKCATLLFGLVKDHPFHDANKRTAFLCVISQLRRLNRTPSIRQREIEEFVVDVAEGKLSKHPRFALFANASDDPEIRFIADYLRRNTREVDKQQYTVTFHELRTILRRYGFELVSPAGNYINVVKYEKVKTFLGFGRPKTVERRVAQIGFPGWKKQVQKGALKEVREAANLTPEHGYDSKAFFDGVEPLFSLIDEYESPLRRLADR